jgi:hypothetical protein
VEAKVKRKTQALYETTCRQCQATLPFTCAIWKDGQCREIRYVCPTCGDRQERGCRLLPKDEALLERIKAKEIHEWYPKNHLYYPDGQPFKEKQSGMSCLMSCSRT